MFNGNQTKVNVYIFLDFRDVRDLDLLYKIY
jgi:hypothetical protein